MSVVPWSGQVHRSQDRGSQGPRVPSPQPLGRVAGHCSSSAHRLPLGMASQEDSWRAQVQNMCGFVSPQAHWVHHGRSLSRVPRDPKQPRLHVWGRPALYSRSLIPVPLLGSGPHTWG